MLQGRYDYHDTRKQIEYLHGLRKSENYKYKISVELEKASKVLGETILVFSM